MFKFWNDSRRLSLPCSMQWQPFETIFSRFCVCFCIFAEQYIIPQLSARIGVIHSVADFASFVSPRGGVISVFLKSYSCFSFFEAIRLIPSAINNFGISSLAFLYVAIIGADELWHRNRKQWMGTNKAQKKTESAKATSGSRRRKLSILLVDNP